MQKSLKCLRDESKEKKLKFQVIFWLCTWNAGTISFMSGIRPDISGWGPGVSVQGGSQYWRQTADSCHPAKQHVVKS